MKSNQRRIVAIATAILGVPIVALLLVLGLAQTPPGKRLLAGLIEDLAGSPQQQIRIEGLTGFVPFDIGVGRLEIADAKGVWLSASSLTLDWSPLALLGSRLKVERLHAAAVEIVRQPVDDGTSRSADDGAGSGLPRRIDIEAVRVDELTLGAEIAGERAQWRLQGAARVAGLQEDNWLTLKAERSDGGEGLVDLHGRYQGARQHLEIKLTARESAATINRYSQVEARTGVEMLADISGPLDGLNGTLTIDAGDMLRVDGQVRAERRAAATETTLTLTGRIGALGDDPWLEALRGDWSLTANGSFDAAAIALRQAQLQGPPGRLSGSGRIDRRDDTADLSFAASLAAVAFGKALPEATWQSLTAEGRLAGKLVRPSITAAVRVENAQLGEVKLGEAAVDFDGGIEADGTRAAIVQAGLNRIVLPAAGDRTLTTEARIAASLSQPRNGPIAVHDFNLASPVLSAEGSGQYEAQRNLASGTLRATAADLSVFADAVGLDIAGRLDLSLQAERAGRQQTAIALDGTLQNGKLPQIPAPLLQPQLAVSLRGALGSDQAWSVQSLKLESAAGSLVAQGQGAGRQGQAQVEWTLHDLRTVDPQMAGRSSGIVELRQTADALTARLDGALSEARIGVAEVPRLALILDARRAQGETTGTLSVDGQMRDAPIQGGGDFALADDGRAAVRNFDLHWSGIAVTGDDFAIGPDGASGDLAIKADNLQQLNPFLPVRLAGSLDATLKAVANNKIKVSAAARNFRLDDSVALDRAQIDGEIADPLGRAAFELTASASGSKLAGPLRQATLKASGTRADFAFNLDGTGENLRATAQGRAAIGESETTVSLQSLTAIQSGQQVVLASPARIRLAGETVSVERAVLRAGDGSVSVAGTLGPNGNLDVQGRGLPLQLLRAFDPDLQLFGVANFTAALTGPLAQPKIDLTLEASDMRLRTIRTAGIPPGALNAKAVLQGDTVTFEGRFSAGRDNVLNFSGSGPLPGPNGVGNGRLRLEGGIRLAQLTPFLGGNGRLNGNLAVDLTLTASNGAIGGDGAIRIVEGRYFNLANGIAIRDIAATIAVVGDRLEVRNFTARPRHGEVTVDGHMRIDPQLTLPVELAIVARSARILDRRDVQATISANLRLSGSVGEGLSLDGNAKVERAELDLGANVSSGPEIASLDVREINRPGGAPDDKPPRARLPGPELRLAVRIEAPQNVFVRGRGLDVELGGAFAVSGTLSQPRIEGALNLRRGTFSGVGRRLEFTRGTVGFPDPNRLQPAIDFTATARIEGGTAEIRISGTPEDPKVKLTSAPPLPEDEIMARLLFGRATAQLSPLQLAEIASSIGTLSGMASSGGGILENLRKALGFDRLGVSSDPDATAAGSSPLGGTSLEVGRNIAPGVYVGAKQGAASGSSSAVVEIEVTPNIKVESEVGTDARSKVGVTIEWDY
ncbi:MAG: translocation/assembly module TamB domain-containing protein [Reyranellaceae bacterium]